MQCGVVSFFIMRRPRRQRRSTHTRSTAAMIAAAMANKDNDECGDDKGGGLSTGVMQMDVDRESLAGFSTDSGTTIIEEESDSEEEEDWGASAQEEVARMRDNARCIRTRNGQRTLPYVVYDVLLNAGGSLRVKEILGFIQAQKLYVFRWKDDSVISDRKKMLQRVGIACRQSPLFVRIAYGTYAIAKEYLNGSNAPNASTSPLQDAIYHVLQDAGKSLHYKDILARIQAKKLYVFKRRDGSGLSNLKTMQDSVNSACYKSPRFAPTEPGTGIYTIAKEYLNAATTDKVKEEEPNANTNNNNNNNMMCSSPSPYALDLKEALESGLMTEEEYAEAVQEAQRYKSPEKKKEIADYNEALRIIFASKRLTDKQRFTVKREYLEEVGLCKPPCRPPSKKRRRRKASSTIVKVKQEE